MKMGLSRKLTAAALSLSVAFAQAAPDGGQVVSGAGSITQSGATTTINQATQNLSLDWQSFNIAPTETVNFVQPSATAIAVNRIFDTNGTQILGHLNANGQVYLTNPNGILFGQGAQVNVGALVASTLGFNDASLNGSTRTFSGNGSGSIVNQGTINAAGTDGYVALLGNTVSNQGTITALLGAVALGAGSAATLTFQNSSLVKMQVDQSVLNTLAENGGLIRADGGLVLMSAGAKDALLASVVNNTGVIEARTVQEHNGTIILLGGMTAGTVNVGGTLDASASNGGNGGFIETSAAHVKIADDAKITTAAPAGKTGTWLIDPTDFTIAAGSGSLTTSGIGATTLSNSLGSSNVSIATSADTAGNGDIFVNSAVSWDANLLTLNAHRNININADLNATSTASLALLYGQGAVKAGNTSNIITAGAAVNLPAGTSNFTTTLGSDGAVKAYTVITSLGAAGSTTATDLQEETDSDKAEDELGAAGSTTATDLQGMNSGLTTNYALGSNIDATATSGWNAGLGFTPIGNVSTPFVGTFDGLGHTVSALTINRPAVENTGLFGYASTGSLIQNVGLVGGSVTGAAGTGALVGNNTTGTVNNSYATGAVTGAAGTGGLVGSNTSGAISNSYAAVTGNVTGAAGTGGLVGSNTTGDAGTGGLVGSTSYAISNSFWDVDTSGSTTSVGGGIGMHTAEMKLQNNFTSATTANGGANPGWDFANTWVILNGSYPLLKSLVTYATVTANNDTTTYSGQTGSGYSGGNGVTYTGTLSGTVSYSGNSQGAKNAGNYAITPGGLISTNQQHIVSFANGALTIGKAAATVTGNSGNATYSGVSQSLTGFSATGLVNGETASVLTNVSASGSGTNAGSYNVVATGTDSNYNLTLNNGALTIGKAAATVTGNSGNATYSGVATTYKISDTSGAKAAATVTANSGNATYASTMISIVGTGIHLPGRVINLP
ncbi:MAG: filamentous hemagglutinin N-terminal domain-containing protein [Nitrosomonadaceae bacterium]|nr:filamentous hemagglutinin N-terminal domain-containing protein [Nitrosomonadaceae bacterium]